MERRALKDAKPFWTTRREALERYGELQVWSPTSLSARPATRLHQRNHELRALTESQAQRIAELEARNEALEAFAHTVAHDLKGSLGSMISFAELLKDRGIDLSAEERELCLSRITATGWKLNSVVDALLLLGSTRHNEVSLDPLDMGSIVQQAHERVAQAVEDHKARVALPDTWPVALGYGPWVEEVWVNYMSNALRYGGEPPHVEIGASQERGFARFSVRDNGRGLTPAEQEALFKPTSLPRWVRKKGHGLGLKIVLQIVERLGGAVGVESQPGQGCTFSFTLPLANHQQHAGA